jgi:hypothetical protein
MCERLVVLKPVIQNLAGIENGKFVPADICLTEEEWTIVAMGKVVLGPIMVAQKVLEGELYITNSLVVGTIFILRSNLYATLAEQQKLAAEDAAAPTIIECLSSMINAFNQRFGEGTNVVPLNTPRLCRGRQPKAAERYNALAGFCNMPGSSHERLNWYPRS